MTVRITLKLVIEVLRNVRKNVNVTFTTLEGATLPIITVIRILYAQYNTLKKKPNTRFMYYTHTPI